MFKRKFPSLPAVYLAGPDVFNPEAISLFEKRAQQCLDNGIEALIPLDTQVPCGLRPDEKAHFIYLANLQLLSMADGVLANLAPFRGTEPDSGTVFEVGFAIARGIPVVSYGTSSQSYRESVAQVLQDSHVDEQNRMSDGQGLFVEDFGLPLNLMLACSTLGAASFSQALTRLLPLLPRTSKT